MPRSCKTNIPFERCAAPGAKRVELQLPGEEGEQGGREAIGCTYQHRPAAAHPPP